MSDEQTTTVYSTITTTFTKTLTRTILSVMSFSTASASGLPFNKANDHGYHSASSSLYPYRPSLVLSIIFTILYLLVTCHHGYLSLYLPTTSEIINKHRYTIPLFIASFLSFLGFLLRSISITSAHHANLPLYATSTAMILISPTFICLTLYFLLTRLIIRCLPPPSVATPITPRGITTTATATTSASAFSSSSTSTSSNANANNSTTRTNLQKFLLLPPYLLLTLLVTSDLLSFLLQLLGASLSSPDQTTNSERHNKGTSIILTGLTLQLVTFIVYLLTLHLFCLRVRNTPTSGFNPCIMKVVVAAWIASGFVLVRLLFRLVEVALGADGAAFTVEWCLFVFDAVPVWVALVVLAWWHPVKWIQERGSRGWAGSTGGIGVGIKPLEEVRGRERVRRSEGGDLTIGRQGPGSALEGVDADGPVRRRSRGFGFGLRFK